MQARFEVSGVAGGDGHLRGLSDGRNECGIERSVLRDSVGGQESRGGQVERKHPPGERCKHPVFEPPAQDLTLGWVGSFLAKDSALDLGDGRGGHEEVGDGNGCGPCLDLRVASRNPEGRDHTAGTSRLR